MPRSRRIAIGVENSVEIWNLQDKKQEIAFDGHEATVTRITTSKDESRIVVGDGDGNITVWNAHTGKKLLLLAGHERGTAADPAILGVQAMAWSRDGNTLYSGGIRGGLRAWESQRPSPSLATTRSQVETATRVVDRQALHTADPEALALKLRQDESIPVAIVTLADKIIQARGDHLRFCAEAFERRAAIHRIGLKRNWDKKVENSFLQRQQLESELSEALNMYGLDSRQFNDTNSVFKWMSFVNDWCGDAEKTNTAEVFLSTLRSRYPQSPYTRHADATFQAARHQWDKAHQRLVDASKFVDEQSNLGFILSIEAAAVELEVDDQVAYRRRCNQLLDTAAALDEPRILWRIARVCLAGDLPEERSRIAGLIDRVDVSELPQEEVAWYRIVQAKVHLEKQEFTSALASSKEAFDHIVEGPRANYARSVAAYQMGLAAGKIGETEAQRKGDGAHAFILGVQSFVRPDTQDVHRSWEDWAFHKFFTQE